jgi:hypothetical protein
MTKLNRRNNAYDKALDKANATNGVELVNSNRKTPLFDLSKFKDTLSLANLIGVLTLHHIVPHNEGNGTSNRCSKIDFPISSLPSNKCKIMREMLKLSGIDVKWHPCNVVWLPDSGKIDGSKMGARIKDPADRAEWRRQYLSAFPNSVDHKNVHTKDNYDELYLLIDATYLAIKNDKSIARRTIAMCVTLQGYAAQMATSGLKFSGYAKFR